MRIKFSNYKGFLCDDANTADRCVDIRTTLSSVSGATITSAKGKAGRKGTVECRTDGFDVLDAAWNFQLDGDCTEEEDEEVDEADVTTQKALNYSQWLRSVGFKSTSTAYSSRSEDLSSHTTIYGENILDNPDDVQDQEDAPQDVNIKKEKKKLTPDERKELRRLAREQKHAAKAKKSQKKAKSKSAEALNELKLAPTDQSFSTTRQKIKHLKDLVTQCLTSAKNELTPEHSKNFNDNSRVIQLDDVTVSVGDVKNLLDDEWLSDSNIGWVYAFLNHGYITPLVLQRLKHSKFNQYDDDLEKEILVSPICLLLPTFTFLIANHPIPKELIPVLPKGINDSQFIFCPLNDNDDFAASEGGSHWSLVVFLKLQSESGKDYIQKALVFDSMFQANASETEKLVANMAEILHNPKNNKSHLKWDIIHVRDTPQQTNGSDCGVFVAAITSFLIAQLVALVQVNNNDAYLDLSLSNVRFSATDSRIWMLSTLLNMLENSNSNHNA